MVTGRVVRYAGTMRYHDGGVLSAEGRARREKLRLQAAQMFEQDIDTVHVAQQLRVSTKVGVPMAAALLGGRPGGVGVQGPWRLRVPTG
jgi:hypothetical protein